MLPAIIQQRQRERLQIKPAHPFGVARIQAMPLDAMLSESATELTKLALAETGERHAPITVRAAIANVRFLRA